MNIVKFALRRMQTHPMLCGALTTACPWLKFGILAAECAELSFKGQDIVEAYGQNLGLARIFMAAMIPISSVLLCFAIPLFCDPAKHSLAILSVASVLGLLRMKNKSGIFGSISSVAGDGAELAGSVLTDAFCGRFPVPRKLVTDVTASMLLGASIHLFYESLRELVTPKHATANARTS
jgi:hypothetical protein